MPDTQSDTQKMKFLDVFAEDANEVLTLKVKLRVKDQDFNIGESFRKGERIAGTDFHLLRYFDLAVNPLVGDVYEITGFFPQKKDA
jgi:hypothetical protein